MLVFYFVAVIFYYIRTEIISWDEYLSQNLHTHLDVLIFQMLL